MNKKLQKKKYASWKEEAWENFLSKFWDNRKEGANFIEYTKKDLESILGKYKKSGQGEIRIFHYGHEAMEPVKRRNVSKVPLTRTKWRIVKATPTLEFKEPQDIQKFGIKNRLTDGMLAGIKDSLKSKSNPGETTLLAIANHVGIISNFYNLKERGVLFTGGRQRAGIHLVIDGNNTDMQKAQIEIDGGFEWTNTAVIVEMKSSFQQKVFDTNQALIPMLKWKSLLKNKKVHALVLLAETSIDIVEYWAFDLVEDIEHKMRIRDSKKYILEINNV